MTEQEASDLQARTYLVARGWKPVDAKLRDAVLWLSPTGGCLSTELAHKRQLESDAIVFVHLLGNLDKAYASDSIVRTMITQMVVQEVSSFLTELEADKEGTREKLRAIVTKPEFISWVREARSAWKEFAAELDAEEAK